MNARIRSCSAYRRELLTGHWELAPAGCAGSSSAAPDDQWFPAEVPGTVASALRARGEWSFENAPRRFDAEEWCYRRRFEVPSVSAGEQVIRGLYGLATLAEVSLNGAVLSQSD